MKANRLEMRRSTFDVFGCRKELRPNSTMRDVPPEPLMPLIAPPGALPLTDKVYGLPFCHCQIGAKLKSFTT